MDGGGPQAQRVTTCHHHPITPSRPARSQHVLGAPVLRTQALNHAPSPPHPSRSTPFQRWHPTVSFDTRTLVSPPPPSSVSHWHWQVSTRWMRHNHFVTTRHLAPNASLRTIASPPRTRLAASQPHLRLRRLVGDVSPTTPMPSPSPLSRR